MAMAGNAVLNRLCEASMKCARALSQASGQTEHVYTEVRYAARSWSRHAATCAGRTFANSTYY